ncbi:hypothetical protein ACJ5H2_07600 [Nocardioides sp. R1-1]|uniref:hypothetical protein n=1 Tax=Nocardioides sp. R1-1 TaxID=3383502 RepID=UPI0038CFEC05
MGDGRDHLSRAEITKDALQASAEAAAQAVGEVATILTRAVGDVAAAVGGFATEVFEIKDASRRALAEHAEIGRSGEVPAELEDGEDG